MWAAGWAAGYAEGRAVGGEDVKGTGEETFVVNGRRKNGGLLW